MEQQEFHSQNSHDGGQKIHLNESWEINHWCEELNLRAEELKEIVRRVGPEVGAVKQYVEDRGSASRPS